MTTHSQLPRIAYGLITLAWMLFASFVHAQSSGTDSQAQSLASGFQIMFNQRAGNCVACHSIPDAAGKKSGLQSSFAPPLDTVAARYDTAQLTQWVTDARKINPQTLMPPFGVNLGNGRLLTDAQILDVVAALTTLKPKTN